MKPCQCAAVFLAIVAAATIAFEIWAWDTGHQSISAWVWELEEHNPLVRWVGLALVALLTYHLFLSDILFE